MVPTNGTVSNTVKLKIEQQHKTSQITILWFAFCLKVLLVRPGWSDCERMVIII